MRKLTRSITGINLVVVIVAINLVLGWSGLSGWDLTRDKLHSLASTSKKIVKDVNDIINIKVFITGDLPPEAKPAATKLKTILGEIQRINRNRIVVKYLDPNKDEEARAEAENLGIQPLQFSSVKADKFEISNGYFGLAILYGDKQEVLPVAGDVGNLEYFLVSGIKKLQSDKLPTVLIDDGGEEQNLQILNQYINQIYDVKQIGLGTTAPLPQEASVLLVLKTKDLNDKGAGEKIRNWLREGKALVVFEDKVAVDERNNGTAQTNSVMDEILKENGIEVESKLVLDEVSGIANLRTASGALPIRYPYWVLVQSENINRQLPVMSGISSLMLPWTSPLKIEGGAMSLFTSSQVIAINESLGNLSPIGQQLELAEGEKVVLGAMKTEGVKLAVVGNTRMLLDQYLGNNPPNLTLPLNLIDYFSQDESLLSIRGKALTVSPLRPVEDNLKLLIRIINIINPLVMLIILALIVNFSRRRFNRKDA